VPVVHQKFGAVFLGCYRIFTRVLDYFESSHVDLDPDGRTRVLFDHSRYYHGGLLSKGGGLLEYLLGIPLENDALDDTGSITKLKEDEFSTRTRVVESSFEDDLLSDVAFQFIDVYLIHMCQEIVLNKSR